MKLEEEKKAKEETERALEAEKKEKEASEVQARRRG